MSGVIGGVVFQAEVDLSKMQTGLNQAKQTALTFSESVDKSLSSIGKNINLSNLTSALKQSFSQVQAAVGSAVNAINDGLKSIGTQSNLGRIAQPIANAFTSIGNVSKQAFASITQGSTQAAAAVTKVAQATSTTAQSITTMASSASSASGAVSSLGSALASAASHAATFNTSFSQGGFGGGGRGGGLFQVLTDGHSKLNAFAGALETVGRGATTVFSGVGSALGAVTGALGGLTRSFAYFGGMIYGVKAVVNTFQGLASAVLGSNASIEQVTIAFTGLLGSADAATRKIAELKKFAAATPFQFQDLVKGTQLLLAYGTAAEDVTETLRILGDAVSFLGGGQAEIERIIRAFGQMQAKGRVMQGELNQLAEVGINGLAIIAEQAGKSIEEVAKLSHEGKLLANEALPMLLQGLDDAFGGGMQKQAQTFNGLISTIKDSLTFAFQEITFPIFEQAKIAAQGLTDYLNSPAFTAWSDNMTEKVAEWTAGFSSFISETGPGLLDLLSNIASKMVEIAEGAGKFAAALPNITKSPVEQSQGITETSAATGQTFTFDAAAALAEIEEVDEATKDHTKTVDVLGIAWGGVKEAFAESFHDIVDNIRFQIKLVEALNKEVDELTAEDIEILKVAAETSSLTSSNEDARDQLDLLDQLIKKRTQFYTEQGIFEQQYYEASQGAIQAQTEAIKENIATSQARADAVRAMDPIFQTQADLDRAAAEAVLERMYGEQQYNEMLQDLARAKADQVASNTELTASELYLQNQFLEGNTVIAGHASAYDELIQKESHLSQISAELAQSQRDLQSVQDTLGGAMDVFNSSASQATSAMGTMEKAHDVLIERQKQGIELYPNQIAFLEQYETLMGRQQGVVDDSVVAAGLMAGAQTELILAQDAVNRATEEGVENLEPYNERVDKARELLDGFDPNGPARQAMEELAGVIKDDLVGSIQTLIDSMQEWIDLQPPPKTPEVDTEPAMTAIGELNAALDIPPPPLIPPDDSAFLATTASAKTAVEEDVGKAEGTASIYVEDGEFKATIAGSNEILEEFSGNEATPKAGLDNSQFTTNINNSQAGLDTFADQTAEPKADLDTTIIDQDITELTGQITILGSLTPTPTVSLNGAAAAESSITTIRDGLIDIDGMTANAQVNVNYVSSGKPTDIGFTEMAVGGYVSKPTLALIGEKGPEIVVPLSGIPGGNPREVADGTHADVGPSYWIPFLEHLLVDLNSLEEMMGEAALVSKDFLDNATSAVSLVLSALELMIKMGEASIEYTPQVEADLATLKHAIDKVVSSLRDSALAAGEIPESMEEFNSAASSGVSAMTSAVDLLVKLSKESVKYGPEEERKIADLKFAIEKMVVSLADAAELLNTEYLEHSTTFNEAAASGVAVMSDALDFLIDLSQVSSEQIRAFAYLDQEIATIAMMCGMIAGRLKAITETWSGDTKPSIEEFAAVVEASTGSLSAVLEFLEELSSTTARLMRGFGQFEKQIEQLAKFAAIIAEAVRKAALGFENEVQPDFEKFAGAVENSVTVVTSVVEVITDLEDETTVVGRGLIRFERKIRQLAALGAMIANAVAEVAKDWKTEVNKKIEALAGDIGASADIIGSVGDILEVFAGDVLSSAPDQSTIDAALAAYVDMAIQFAQAFKTASAGWGEASESLEGFAGDVGNSVSIISDIADAFEAIVNWGKTGKMSNKMPDRIEDMKKLLNMVLTAVQEVAKEWHDKGTEAMGKWAEDASKMVGLFGDVVDATSDIADMGKITTRHAEVFKSNIMTILGIISDLAREIAPYLDDAMTVQAVLEAVAAAIGAGSDAINDVLDQESKDTEETAESLGGGGGGSRGSGTKTGAGGPPPGGGGGGGSASDLDTVKELYAEAIALGADFGTEGLQKGIEDAIARGFANPEYIAHLEERLQEIIEAAEEDRDMWLDALEGLQGDGTYLADLQEELVKLQGELVQATLAGSPPGVITALEEQIALLEKQIDITEELAGTMATVAADLAYLESMPKTNEFGVPYSLHGLKPEEFVAMTPGEHQIDMGHTFDGCSQVTHGMAYYKDAKGKRHAVAGDYMCLGADAGDNAKAQFQLDEVERKRKKNEQARHMMELKEDAKNRKKQGQTGTPPAVSDRGPWDTIVIWPMAAGGLITRPTLALLGERGPEMVIPVGHGSSQSALKPVIHNHFHVNSKEVTSEISRDLMRMQYQRGDR